LMVNGLSPVSVQALLVVVPGNVGLSIACLR